MKTNQWSRWSTSTDAPSSCNRGGRRPALKNEGSVPTRLADHTLLLQCRQYLEARDLRRTKYGYCSKSTVACYNRRFLNVQQHSIRRRTAPWATGSAEVMEAALTGISGMLFVGFLLSVVWLSSLRGVRSCGGRHGLGSRSQGLFGLFVFRFLLVKNKSSPAGLLGLLFAV